jgi:diguanylate cyclase (GGDEF)-like protein/PAS domain S-box-containing protein
MGVSEKKIEQLANDLAEMRQRIEALQAAEAQRAQMDQALKVSYQRYQDFYDHAPDLFMSVDAVTGRIIQCNTTLAAAIGYEKEELMGRHSFELYHPDCLESAQKAFEVFVKTGEVHDAELQLKRKDGSKVDVSLNLTAVRDAGGNILYSRSVCRDITARKRAEEVLAEQAIRDALTGLYNRRYFHHRLQEEMDRAQRSMYRLGFLICDLDNFKAVNDTQGHQSGDEVLKAAAKIIQSATRGSDLVFRWGGDEMVVVLAETSEEGIRVAAKRIRRGIQGLRDKTHADLDISIGVAIYPENAHQIEDLVHLADRSLYIAKKDKEKIHFAREDFAVDGPPRGD